MLCHVMCSVFNCVYIVLIYRCRRLHWIPTHFLPRFRRKSRWPVKRWVPSNSESGKVAERTPKKGPNRLGNPTKSTRNGWWNGTITNLVGGLNLWLSIYWEFHHPNWLSYLIPPTSQCPRRNGRSFSRFWWHQRLLCTEIGVKRWWLIEILNDWVTSENRSASLRKPFLLCGSPMLMTCASTCATENFRKVETGRFIFLMFNLFTSQVFRSISSHAKNTRPTLVGGVEHFSFFHILGMSSSQLTNSIIFQRGRSTTTQIVYWSSLTIS